MLTHYPFSTLGGANHGWLDAKHHFSFATYFDPQKLSFGELLVINDDRIAPHTGFDPHGHRNMEIITFVRRGAITHKDSEGNEGRTSAGNVQVMSAGTGIVHSEYNLEDEETNIFQIWIKPRSDGIAPKWDSAEFPTEPVDTALTLLVSGDGSAPLHIHQDARIYAGRLTSGTTITHSIRGQAYLLISEGAAEIGRIPATKGDGIAISDRPEVQITASEEADIVIIEVPGLSDAR